MLQQSQIHLCIVQFKQFFSLLETNIHLASSPSAPFFIEDFHCDQWKWLENNLILDCGNAFRLVTLFYFLIEQLHSRQQKTNIYGITLFWLVETSFLSIGNHFFYSRHSFCLVQISFSFFLQWEPIFFSVSRFCQIGTVF